MDGPVLSGGVIILVAALLWMLYLLPSWLGRYQYNAAERNAVRLNQALRVFAETSDAPQEVHLELTARTALAQQKLAKRIHSEKEVAELAALRAELAATKADPLVRQAHARRNTRRAATVALFAGLAMAGVGGWQLSLGAASALLWVGGAVVVLAFAVLQRMAAVAATTARRTFTAAAREAEPVAEPVAQVAQTPSWTPRKLPEPLVTRRGSLAQTTQATIEAREQLLAAARDAELRQRAEELAPPAPVTLSPYATVGLVNDEEIEAHVRDLLARRAAG